MSNEVHLQSVLINIHETQGGHKRVCPLYSRAPHRLPPLELSANVVAAQTVVSHMTQSKVK